MDDNDLNIYEVYFEGGNMILGSPIGVTLTITSFYDSDKEKWATESFINPNDYSGEEFFSKIINEPHPLFDDYMVNATKEGKYDFKLTNGTDKVISKEDAYKFRGMPLGATKDGRVIYESARDIGNMAAGYIAAINGMGWKDSRFAFDVYQMGIEGMTTQNAEYLGWCIGYNRTDPIQRPKNFRN